MSTECFSTESVRCGRKGVMNIRNNWNVINELNEVKLINVNNLRTHIVKYIFGVNYDRCHIYRSNANMQCRSTNIDNPLQCD